MNDLVISKAHRIILIDERNCSLGILTFIKSLKCSCFNSIILRWGFQAQLRKTYLSDRFQRAITVRLEQHSILSSSFPPPLPLILFFSCSFSFPFCLLSFFHSFLFFLPSFSILVKKNACCKKFEYKSIFSFYRLFLLFHS